jgi:hypothetical protein
MRALRSWVGLWDVREHPRSLALVRILMAAVLLWDFAQVLQLDLVVPLFGPLEAGGLGNPLGRKQPPLLYELLPATAGVAQGTVLAVVGLSATLMVGLLPRLSAALLVVLLAQLALVLPPADRGIDMLVRNTLVVLAFSRCGDTLSLGPRLQTGSWRGRADARIPAWPRLLLIAQLVVLYFAAGVSKVASSWTPFGGWSALYVAMRDPAFARIDPSWLDQVYLLTQLGTVATWLWEWCAPLMLLAYWYRNTPDRPGRLRAWFNRVNFLHVYLLVGAIFHLGTHLSLQLGIFPFAVLALYPAAFRPDEWGRWGGALRARLARSGATEGAERGRMRDANPPQGPL